MMIACVDKNWGIGYQNKLQFDIPEDKKFFKNKTMGKTIVMGFNTFKSIKNPLKRRHNIVIDNKCLENWKFSDDLEFMSSELFEKYLEDNKDNPEEIWIIGGQCIYHKYFRRASEIYITKVDVAKDADRYFPNLDFYNGYNITEVILEGITSEGYNYKICKWINNDPSKKYYNHSF